MKLPQGLLPGSSKAWAGTQKFGFRVLCLWKISETEMILTISL